MADSKSVSASADATKKSADTPAISVATSVGPVLGSQIEARLARVSIEKRRELLRVFKENPDFTIGELMDKVGGMTPDVAKIILRLKGLRTADERNHLHDDDNVSRGGLATAERVNIPPVQETVISPYTQIRSMGSLDREVRGASLVYRESKRLAKITHQRHVAVLLLEMAPPKVYERNVLLAVTPWAPVLGEPIKAAITVTEKDLPKAQALCRAIAESVDMSKVTLHLSMMYFASNGINAARFSSIDMSPELISFLNEFKAPVEPGLERLSRAETDGEDRAAGGDILWDETDDASAPEPRPVEAPAHEGVYGRAGR